MTGVQTSGVSAAASTFVPNLALAALLESPLNPRKHFDAKKLEELKTSIATIGIQTPLTARDLGKGKYMLAAGHRRYRAAKLAGLEGVPVLAREMTDTEFLEILNVDNLQREDVHPLEEAAGYKNLLTADGYNIEKIVELTGKSESYVYDRLKLLSLTKEAQKLFLANRFTAGHAILLARLSTKDQERCLEVSNSNSYGSARGGGMWQHEGPAHLPLGLEDPSGFTTDDRSRRHLKPVSVRELQAWIDDHVRFETPDPSTPHLFAQTAENLAALADKPKAKTIKITRDWHVDDDVKNEDERIYSVKSWVRADGQTEPANAYHRTPKPSKTCDYSVLGIIAAGAGRGESFLVCVNKNKCTTHYGSEIRARQRREKERSTAESKGGVKKAKPAEPQENGYEKEQRLRQQRADRANARWAKGGAAVEAAIVNAVKRIPVDSRSVAATWLWDEVQDGLRAIEDGAKAAAKLGCPRGATAADFLRHLISAALLMVRDDSPYWAEKSEVDLQKHLDSLRIKVKVQQLLDAANPEPKKEKAIAGTKAVERIKAAAKGPKKKGKK